MVVARADPDQAVAIAKTPGVSFWRKRVDTYFPTWQTKRKKGARVNTLTRLGTCTAALAVAIFPATTLEIVKAAAEGTTRVPLVSDLRRCDFSRVNNQVPLLRPTLGSASAVLQITGSSATAEVQLYSPANPGAHYDVGLIQEPLPSSATCGPGAPGTAFTGIDTDGGGNATTTVRSGLNPGTKGVWVIVERASGDSQNPAEVYTSDFLAPV
jgi:hypothetical protein